MKGIDNKIAVWYDRFYKKSEGISCPSWYRYLIEEIPKYLNINSKILEVGCGNSFFLKWLYVNHIVKEKNIYGIDQSKYAVNYLKKRLPLANIRQENAHNLKFQDKSMDIVAMMEVIEHLEKPTRVLSEIFRVLKKDGFLFLSFPNYQNFPWLIIRLLSEKLNKPNWLVLQPIDKIYLFDQIISMCKNNGFSVMSCLGTTYFPPLLWKYENKKITNFFNSLFLYRFSFHPILIFKK